MNIEATIDQIEYCNYEQGIKYFVLRNIIFSTPDCPIYAGYVVLPEEHPLYGITYLEHPGLCALNVHKGLTFTNGVVIGFDTLHFDDYNPLFHEAGGRRWPLKDVIRETHELAEQVAELADKKKGH